MYCISFHIPPLTLDPWHSLTISHFERPVTYSPPPNPHNCTLLVTHHLCSTTSTTCYEDNLPSRETTSSLFPGNSTLFSFITLQPKWAQKQACERTHTHMYIYTHTHTHVTARSTKQPRSTNSPMTIQSTSWLIGFCPKPCCLLGDLATCRTLMYSASPRAWDNLVY